MERTAQHIAKGDTSFDASRQNRQSAPAEASAFLLSPLAGFAAAVTECNPIDKTEDTPMYDTVKGRRMLALTVVVRLNQIEVSHDKFIGFDESQMVTLV